jgi:hypothetical protein
MYPTPFSCPPKEEEEEEKKKKKPSTNSWKKKINKPRDLLKINKSHILENLRAASLIANKLHKLSIL